MPLIGMAGASVMLMPMSDALKIAIAHEFDAFEVFGEFPQCVCDEVSGQERREGRAAVQSSGIALAVHAAFNSLNIAALNPGVRRESVKQVKDAIDLCADLSGRIVITHTGEYVTSERIRNEVPQAGQIQWDYNIASLKSCAAHAKERGIILCLENIGFEPEHMDQSVDDMLKIREQVDEPALAFCIDIGHARLNRELPAAIAKMGPFAAHIHFTDNFGKKDDHVVIGQGNSDYTPHLEFFRSFPHIITLEAVAVGTDPAPALQSREHLRRLLAGR
ncbi:MAG TPA: sugar phosphate isomerase/epimerase family protein [bacterium]|nr:sugar phosphate isomerase/epimerase family protein [bacterium]